jgi:hypothetical protein
MCGQKGCIYTRVWGIVPVNIQFLPYHPTVSYRQTYIQYLYMNWIENPIQRLIAEHYRFTIWLQRRLADSMTHWVTIRAGSVGWISLHPSRSTGYRLAGRGFDSRQGQVFSLIQSVQTGSEAHSDSYSMGTGVSWSCWVGIASDYGLDDQGIGVRVTMGAGIFKFSMSFRLALGPTQPHIQRVPVALSPAVKRSGREADHSPTTSAEVKKTWVYTSTPPYVFMM